MNRFVIFTLIFLVCPGADNAQFRLLDSVMPFTTSVKINVNGLRVGIEQKLFKRNTLLVEFGQPNFSLSAYKYDKHFIAVNSQARHYLPINRNSLAFIAIAWLYKQDKYSFVDSFRIIGSTTASTKQMAISKYINAFTVGTGYFWRDRIFKHLVLFEFNPAAGIRLKKSTRDGLAVNEEIVWGEAFLLRPLREQDTGGKFKLYPELNLILRVVIPLIQ